MVVEAVLICSSGGYFLYHFMFRYFLHHVVVLLSDFACFALRFWHLHVTVDFLFVVLVILNVYY